MQHLCEVKDSPIHGKGVFALVDITSGTYICVYDGELKKERPQNVDETDYVLKVSGGYLHGYINPKNDIGVGQLINDANNINQECLKGDWSNIIYAALRYVCKDHAQTNITFTKCNDKYWAVAIKPIKSGEELTFSYGYEYWLERLPRSDQYKQDILLATCFIRREYAQVEYHLIEQTKKTPKKTPSSNEVLLKIAHKYLTKH